MCSLTLFERRHVASWKRTPTQCGGRGNRVDLELIRAVGRAVAAYELDTVDVYVELLCVTDGMGAKLMNDGEKSAPSVIYKRIKREVENGNDSITKKI